MTFSPFSWFRLILAGCIGGSLSWLILYYGQIGAQLTCVRTVSDQGSCELNNLFVVRQVQYTIPLASIQRADLETLPSSLKSQAPPRYRLQLVTPTATIPLEIHVQRDRAVAQNMADLINRFLRNPSQLVLTLSDLGDPRPNVFFAILFPTCCLTLSQLRRRPVH